VELHQYWFDRTAAKDLDGLISHIAAEIISYEHTPAALEAGGPLRQQGGTSNGTSSRRRRS
jgi:hypothetical protein